MLPPDIPDMPPLGPDGPPLFEELLMLDPPIDDPPILGDGGCIPIPGTGGRVFTGRTGSAVGAEVDPEGGDFVVG